MARPTIDVTDCLCFGAVPMMKSAKQERIASNILNSQTAAIAVPRKIAASAIGLRTVASAGLGTVIENAIAKVSKFIPSERIRKWLGSCKTCKDRRDRLNAFTWWAAGYVLGRRTVEQLQQMMEQDL